MTQSVRDLENTFLHAWELLRDNPVIIVPGVVLALVGALISMAVTHALGNSAVLTAGELDANWVNAFIEGSALFVVSLAIGIVQMAYMTGMAGGAWLHEHTTLADGWTALRRTAFSILLAGMLVLAIAVCAEVLATVTFGLTLLATVLFLIYTMAAVIIGEREPVAAVVESCRLALENVVPTLAVVAIVAVIAAIGGWIGWRIGTYWPFVGSVTAGLLQQVVVAYASLVVAGEYLKLRKQPVD